MRYNRYLVSLYLILIILPMGIFAQDKASKSLFIKRDFGKYFISDIFSPAASSNLSAGLLRSEYNLNPDRNSTYAIYIDSYLGVEIPVLAIDYNEENHSRLAFSIPVSANFLLDISEPITHPMINTDYRIGFLEVNYLYEIGTGFLKNAAVKFIPYYHESSHLGDEITVYRKDAGFPITRVNATNNTAEIALTINDENGSREANHSFKVGTRILYKKSNGFYRMRPAEGDTSKINPSSNRFEWYGQYQWHSPSGIIKNPAVTKVLSLELRSRVLYDYPYYIDDPKNSQGLVEVNPDRKYVPSLNGYLGWRYSIAEERASFLGLYFRFYLGVNPYGQFRNIPDHRFFGMSMVYEN